MLQNPFHTAEEMRQISNLAHVVEGIVLGAAAVLALAQAQGWLRAGKLQYLWPALVVTAGAFLLAYLLIPHHGLALASTQWEFIFGDPQQRQHVVISLLVLMAGTLELLALAGKLEGRIWRLAWPTALGVVGLLFIIHEQHGTSDAVARATLLHRVLGGTLLLAGIAAGANVLRPRPSRVLNTLWPLALLAAAVMLMIYREPEGAYHGAPSDHGASHPEAPKQQ